MASVLHCCDSLKFSKLVNKTTKQVQKLLTVLILILYSSPFANYMCKSTLHDNTTKLDN